MPFKCSGTSNVPGQSCPSCHEATLAACHMFASCIADSIVLSRCIGGALATAYSSLPPPSRWVSTVPLSRDTCSLRWASHKQRHSPYRLPPLTGGGPRAMRYPTSTAKPVLHHKRVHSIGQRCALALMLYAALQHHVLDTLVRSACKTAYQDLHTWGCCNLQFSSWSPSSSVTAQREAWCSSSGAAKVPSLQQCSTRVRRSDGSPLGHHRCLEANFGALTPASTGLAMPCCILISAPM